MTGSDSDPQAAASPAEFVAAAVPGDADAAPILGRIFDDPVRAVSLAKGVLGAVWFRFWFRLTGKRFRVGHHCRIYHRLRIEGPGEVTLGNHVVIVEPVRIRTHSREARVIIGDGVTMGGADIQCQREIRIGDGCLLAPCVIMDTDFHSIRADRHDPRAPIRVAPVHIGRNVWIARNAGILQGVKIGDNSVVAFGAVCTREFPGDVIIMGNPAKVAAPIPAARPMELAEPSRRPFATVS